MTSRERIIAAWAGTPVDHVPLTTWCFGFQPPAARRWRLDEVERRFWYTLRLEHLHTLPQAWTLEDDARRVRAWQALGVDDLLEVSVPWSQAPEVSWADQLAPSGTLDPEFPVLIRDYQTPAGCLRHAVRQTGENPGAGWVVQPACVPLFEDYNIPRAVKHAITGPAEVRQVQYLYAPPDDAARAWFTARMAAVRDVADREQVAVQAWAAFGMDAVVWLTGTEGAVMLAMDAPAAFGELFDAITATDLARVELAAATPGVDLVCERGWYSSTDFWSPTLFDCYVLPHIAQLAQATHRHGKRFGYVMTTGVEILGPRLADAGVDVLYFIDPIQDKITLETAARLLGGRMTLVGGTNALSLASGKPERIRTEVRRALEILGPTNRFILHPVDAIFPDTPWAGIETLIAAWEEYR